MNCRYATAMAFVCLVIGLPHTTAEAQQLGRRVLSASGSSAGNGQVRLSWTLGQIETRAFRSTSDTTVVLTQGFQQFYSKAPGPTAGLWIDDCAAAPGSRVTTKINLGRADAKYAFGPTFLRIRLTYNGSLVLAESFTDGTTVIRHEPSIDTTVLELQVPVDQFAIQQTLAEITFVAGLGNDTTTPLHIASVTPTDRNIGITITDGRFTLLGVCYEGGPRLIDISGVTPFVRIIPNPIVTNGRVEFAMPDEAPARIYVVSEDGRIVSTMLDAVVPAGTYQMPFNMDEIASGAYLLIFETSIRRYSQRFVVRR